MQKIGSITIDDTYYPGKDLYSDGEIEDEMLDIAKNVPVSEYNRVIAERKSWAILYHFSNVRENIVQSMPITKEDSVLEIGAGCGAITGVLARMAKNVDAVELSMKRSLINAYRHQEADNITIKVGNFQEVEQHLEKKYDVIQGVGAALVAGDGQLVQPGGVRLACQLHRVGDVGLFGPAVGGEPRVGLFVLHAVLKGLVEQAEVIPQTHTVAGQVQRGQRVKEAGGQTAQTAVAERRLRLYFFDVCKALPGSSQRVAGFVVQTQIDEVVGQQLADEKFGADIIELTAGHRLHTVSTLAPDKFQQGKIQFLIRAGRKRFAGKAL